MKKALWYSLAYLVYIFIFLTPTIQTYDQPAVDGSMLIGFPFNFYSYGGYCGGVCKEFLLLPFLFDLFFLLLVPYITASWIEKGINYFRKDKNKK